MHKMYPDGGGEKIGTDGDEKRVLHGLTVVTNNRKWNLRILRKLRIEAGPIILICCLYNFEVNHTKILTSQGWLFVVCSFKFFIFVYFSNFHQFQNSEFQNLDENTAFVPSNQTIRCLLYKVSAEKRISGLCEKT